MSKLAASNPTPPAPLPAHAKIKTIEELGEIARAAQAQGRTVALCHGVFDLVHLGHVRHIQAARNEGDVVIVTITADRYVNKGPGRPIFPENMRAEMLASLASVDWVGINQHLQRRAGPRYRPARHLCEGIGLRKPRRRHHRQDQSRARGGRAPWRPLVFTHDYLQLVSLINRYFDIYDPPLRDYLQQVAKTAARTAARADREGAETMHVVLVGDTIIDEYQYVTALGKPSKENIVATLFKNREQFAGGVLAAANHVASFCKSVEIVTVLGGDDYPRGVHPAQLRPNVKLTPIRVDGTSDHAQAPLRRARLPAQALRSLHDGRHAARARPSGRRSTGSPASASAAPTS